jgi:hypothetical protein
LLSDGVDAQYKNLRALCGLHQGALLLSATEYFNIPVFDSREFPSMVGISQNLQYVLSSEQDI